MKREIVKIDSAKCNGCGNCIPNCHEGALQIIDGKAVLISDLMCDGLGACLGHCPEGALEIELREAETYDEIRVMETMVLKGKNVVIAHLKHLKDHNETKYLMDGINYIRHHGALDFDVNEVLLEVQGKPVLKKFSAVLPTPCPGSQTRTFKNTTTPAPASAHMPSALTQWPIQLHLINPLAAFFNDADLLVAADCVAFSLGNFHTNYLPGKKLAIACPKLDTNKEVYLEKLIQMIDHAGINTITVMIMEVPCCGGLLQLVKQAVEKAQRKVPVKAITVGIQGTIM